MYEIGHVPLMIGKTLLEFWGEKYRWISPKFSAHCVGGLKYGTALKFSIFLHSGCVEEGWVHSFIPVLPAALGGKWLPCGLVAGCFCCVPEQVWQVEWAKCKTIEVWWHDKQKQALGWYTLPLLTSGAQKLPCTAQVWATSYTVRPTISTSPPQF